MSARIYTILKIDNRSRLRIKNKQYTYMLCEKAGGGIIMQSH